MPFIIGKDDPIIRRVLCTRIQEQLKITIELPEIRDNESCMLLSLQIAHLKYFFKLFASVVKSKTERAISC